MERGSALIIYDVDIRSFFDQFFGARETLLFTTSDSYQRCIALVIFDVDVIYFWDQPSYDRFVSLIAGMH